MRKIILIIIICVVSGATKTVLAQTTTDALLMSKYELCIAVVYDHGTWDHYWEGANLRVNDNIGTFTRTMAMPMLAYGITDKLNVLASLPYIATKSSGGQLVGVAGFQDFNVALKYEIFNREIGKGKLSLQGVGVFGTPASNYLSDYMPYSLGLGTTEFTLRGMAEYKLDNGFYIRSSYAYIKRGETEVERDYYYNNGSYYTTLMDVPDATNFYGTIGKWFFNYALRVEATYQSMNCLSGDDIRAYNSPQPTNKFEYEQVSFFAQYFFKTQLKGLGLLGYYSKMFDGRNMGEFTNIGGGVTYQFKVINAQ
jgi:hypothetical protein